MLKLCDDDYVSEARPSLKISLKIYVYTMAKLKKAQCLSTPSPRRLLYNVTICADANNSRGERLQK